MSAAPGTGRLRAFLESLDRRRPPTGPLTTSEAIAAEESLQEARAQASRAVEHGTPDAGRAEASPDSTES